MRWLSSIREDSLHFMGRARVGMGFVSMIGSCSRKRNPMPLLVSPLKGEGLSPRGATL
jgi:hypothetical protein